MKEIREKLKNEGLEISTIGNEVFEDLSFSFKATADTKV